MSSKDKQVEVISGSKTNPTRQQREVYSWHEARNSDAADDIFSTEWFKRTKSFLERHSNPESPAVKLENLGRVEDLDFGAFFIEHPIAAFALWQFLQACYALDRAVCLNPLSYENDRRADEIRVEGWEKLPPFQYLNAFASKDGKIRKKWTESMGQLKKEIGNGALEGEKLVSRLYDIYTGIDRLQSSMSALRLSFDDNLKGSRFKRDMLDRAEAVVDERLNIILLVLKLDESKSIPTRANWNAEDRVTDGERDPAPATDTSIQRKEKSPSPIPSTRLRKSNKRSKKPRATSPKKVDPTTNMVQRQRQGLRNSMPASLKYIVIVLVALLVLMLAVSFIYH